MGRFDQAITKLKEYADKKDNDELLYLMDLGLAYHTAGRYKDAITTFLRADRIAEVKDYTSISAEAGAVLLNDEIKSYKGEDFEKLLINMYLAIDYTMAKDWENALVECRKVNHKIDMYVSQGQKPYQHNAFAKYLSAALFEARGEYNDAFVDYRQLLKWGFQSFPYLGIPLLRLAEKLQASQEYDEYRKKFPGVTGYRIGRNEGEIVVLIEQGKVPYKVPSPEFRLVPILQKNHYLTDHAKINYDGKPGPQTYTLFDIETTAIKELKDKAAGIIAKKIGGIAAKEAAAYGVQKATNSELAGALTSIFLHATDTADLRSWTTLPATLQLARFVVPAGRHDFSLDMVTRGGGEIKGAKRWDGVQVKAGEIVFLNYRSTE